MAGLRRDRRMMRSAQNAFAAAVVSALVAIAALEYGLVTHDFSLSVVAEHTSRKLPLIYTMTSLWASQEGSLLLWLLVLTGAATIALRQNRHRNRELMPWVAAVMGAITVFFAGMATFVSSPFAHVVGAVPHDGAGLDPVAAERLHGGPPADALPGLRVDVGAVRVCDGVAHHRPGRCALARVGAALDARVVDGAWDRHAARRPLGLRRDRLGRLLGLGSGRERRPHAVAGRDGLPALDHGAGEEGHAQGLEHGARDRGLRAVPVRRLPDPQRGRAVGALVRAVGGGAVPAGLPRDGAGVLGGRF